VPRVSGSRIFKQWAGAGVVEGEIFTNGLLFLLPLDDIYFPGHLPLSSAVSSSLQPFTRLRKHHNYLRIIHRQRHSIPETRQQRAPVRPESQAFVCPTCVRHSCSPRSLSSQPSARLQHHGPNPSTSRPSAISTTWSSHDRTTRVCCINILKPDMTID
jgi:hypothetical protein